MKTGHFILCSLWDLGKKIELDNWLIVQALGPYLLWLKAVSVCTEQSHFTVKTVAVGGQRVVNIKTAFLLLAIKWQPLLADFYNSQETYYNKLHELFKIV